MDQILDFNDGSLCVLTLGDGGVVTSLRWHREADLQRDSSSVQVWFDADGSANSAMWHRNGVLHRDGAAAIVYWDKGRVCFEEWWVNGVYCEPPKKAV